MMTYTPQLTVRQLIDALQELPDDLLVSTEGCDCDGDAGSVVIEGEGDQRYVNIKRTDRVPL